MGGKTADVEMSKSIFNMTSNFIFNLMPTVAVRYCGVLLESAV